MVTMFKSLIWFQAIVLLNDNKPMPLRLGEALHWRIVGVDGPRCLPTPSTPDSCIFLSIPVHVKDNEIGRVRKSFHTVPTLELPKDRAQAHLSLFYSCLGARNREGAHETMDGFSPLRYPYSCPQQTNNLAAYNKCFQKLPQILPYQPATGHRSCLQKLLGAGWFCSKPENLTLSWC